MVDEAIQLTVRRYLLALPSVGIHARRGVLFGSHARGEADPWSDIDLVVIAPELDSLADRRLVDRMWELRARTDSRIEPIPCGERQWHNDDGSTILAIARREGVVISLES